MVGTPPGPGQHARPGPDSNPDSNSNTDSNLGDPADHSTAPLTATPLLLDGPGRLWGGEL